MQYNRLTSIVLNLFRSLSRLPLTISAPSAQSSASVAQSELRPVTTNCRMLHSPRPIICIQNPNPNLNLNLNSNPPMQLAYVSAGYAKGMWAKGCKGRMEAAQGKTFRRPNCRLRGSGSGSGCVLRDASLPARPWRLISTNGTFSITHW